MRRTPLPHRLTPVYLYFRWDLNPQRFPLGCWFLKPVRFYRFATEAYNGGKSKEWFYWRTWTFKSLFLRQMCIPFHEVTLLITIHYFVALVGNDPTTFSMSRKRSPIELQGIIFWASCQTRTGVPGLQIQNNQPTIRRMRLRYWLGSNQCDRFCRSVPLVFRHHSATVPYVVGTMRLELITFRVSGECSNQLSYVPMALYVVHNW